MQLSKPRRIEHTLTFTSRGVVTREGGGEKNVDGIRTYVRTRSNDPGENVRSPPSLSSAPPTSTLLMLLSLLIARRWIKGGTRVHGKSCVLSWNPVKNCVTNAPPGQLPPAVKCHRCEESVSQSNLVTKSAYTKYNCFAPPRAALISLDILQY